MNDLRTIRSLDKYLGSIICFIFDLLSLFKVKKTRDVKKVLVIELFEMGAGIMAYSAIKYIREKLPDADIYCLATNKTKEVWELLEIIPPENILAVNDRNLFTFAASLLGQLIRLRRKKIDLAIDFELFMRISSIISFLSAAKLRAGFYRYGIEGLYRGNFHDFRCCYNQNTHISKNFLALTKAAVNQCRETPNYKDQIRTSEITVPSYKSNPEIRNKVKAQISALYPDYSDEHIILICPDVGPILPVRNYPADYFVDVINRLLARYPDYLVLLTGVEENDRICSYIESKTADSRCINFCSRLKSLAELFELMSFSKLLLCNDNGPLHFASMTGMKILALFSTDSPFVYGPLGDCVILYNYYHCSPCINAFNNKSSPCRNNLCLQSLEPERVYDFAVKLIEEKPPYRTINGETPYI
jgi:ADP-heptose:LPS heptosyltransferase